MYLHEPVFDPDELLKCNYHIHTSFSRCGKTEMRFADIVDTAARAGLEEIALTDHIHPGEEQKLFRIIPILNRKKERCQTKLKIYIGAELSAYGTGRYTLKKTDYLAAWELYIFRNPGYSSLDVTLDYNTAGSGLQLALDSKGKIQYSFGSALGISTSFSYSRNSKILMTTFTHKADNPSDGSVVSVMFKIPETVRGGEEFQIPVSINGVKKLDGTEVKHTDMRTLLNSHSSDWYGSFFRTDHHWKPETGIWAAGEIAELLNTNFGYGIDKNIGNADNYNIKIYKDYCLGSQGKISTLKFTDPEDFSLVTPKKETDFTVNYYSDYGGTGSFDEVLIDMRAVEKIDYYNISTYSAYLYGNNAATSIKNNNVHNGKRLMILSDSFCKCVVPILAQEIEYIDVVDRRYFTGSIMSYAEQFRPDTVIVAYNPTMISEDSSHGGMFNFE